MKSSLMISVAGVRGIVGDSLTPRVLILLAEAFAHELEPGPVILGRDVRGSIGLAQGPVTYFKTWDGARQDGNTYGGDQNG